MATNLDWPHPRRGSAAILKDVFPLEFCLSSFLVLTYEKLDMFNKDEKVDEDDDDDYDDDGYNQDDDDI